jgi:hypothetical protein
MLEAAASPEYYRAMASKLVNLFRTLEMDDFPPEKSLKKEGSNKNGKIAATAVSFSVDFGGKTIPNFEPASGGGFKLKDDVTVTIKFDKNKSWVAQWVKDLSDSDVRKQFLLDHEQGHYDLMALMARDFFIDLMQFKGRSFADVQDGKSEVTSLHTSYSNDTQAADKKYDSDTNHIAWQQLSIGPPRKTPEQIKWERFFKTAFTKLRNPPQTAPDGKSYKVRLRNVLRDANMI